MRISFYFAALIAARCGQAMHLTEDESATMAHITAAQSYATIGDSAAIMPVDDQESLYAQANKVLTFAEEKAAAQKVFKGMFGQQKNMPSDAFLEWIAALSAKCAERGKPFRRE